jgi:hypothetical protein
MAIEIISEFEAHVQSLQPFERQKLKAELVRPRLSSLTPDEPIRSD